MSWKSALCFGGFPQKFELPKFLAWSSQEWVSRLFNYLLTYFHWTVNNAQTHQSAFCGGPNCDSKPLSYWRRRTHSVDPLVSEHLRTWRRLNPCIFFLCFWSSKSTCSPPPSPSKPPKIAQFNKGMQKL